MGDRKRSGYILSSDDEESDEDGRRDPKRVRRLSNVPRKKNPFVDDDAEVTGDESDGLECSEEDDDTRSNISGLIDDSDGDGTEGCEGEAGPMLFDTQDVASSIMERGPMGEGAQLLIKRSGVAAVTSEYKNGNGQALRDGPHILLRASSSGNLDAYGVRAVGGDNTIVLGDPLAEWSLVDNVSIDPTGLVRVCLRDPSLTTIKVLAASVTSRGKELAIATQELVKLSSEVSYEGAPRLEKAPGVEAMLRTIIWSGKEPKYNFFTMNGATRDEVKAFVKAAKVGDTPLWKMIRWAQSDLVETCGNGLSFEQLSNLVVPCLLIYVVNRILESVDGILFGGVGSMFLGELIFKVDDTSTCKLLETVVSDACNRFVSEQAWSFTLTADGSGAVARSLDASPDLFAIPFDIVPFFTDDEDDDAPPGEESQQSVDVAVDADDCSLQEIYSVIMACDLNRQQFRNWVAEKLVEIDHSMGIDGQPHYISNPKLSNFNKWQKSVVDRIAMLATMFYGIVAGHFVPTGQTIPCSDSVKENTIDMMGGKWYPRELVAADWSKVDKASDRACVCMYVESMRNPNVFSETTINTFDVVCTLMKLCRQIRGVMVEKGEDDFEDGLDIGYDSQVLVCHDVQCNSDFTERIVTKLTGFSSGSGQSSLSQLDVSVGNVARLKLRPPVQRFTFTLKDYPRVVTLTEDGGITATTFKLEEADGRSMGHRSFSVTPDFVVDLQEECEDIMTVHEQFIASAEPLPLDNPDWTTKVFRRLWDMLEDRAPVFASFFGTQYHASQEDITSAFFPKEHVLTDQECLLAIYNIGGWCTSWMASDYPRAVFQNGVPGAGKTVFMEAFTQVVFGGKDAMVVLPGAKKADRDGTREMYKRYLSKTPLYTPGVFPFVAFKAVDRMDKESQIPEEHRDTMLGDDQPQTIEPEAKHKSKVTVEAYVCGVNATGNSVPVSYLKQVENNEITPRDAVMKACIGEQTGASRRCVLLTPFLRTCNPEQEQNVIVRMFPQNVRDIKNESFDDQVLSFLAVATMSFRCVFSSKGLNGLCINPMLIDQHVKAFEALVQSKREQAADAVKDVIKRIDDVDEIKITANDLVMGMSKKVHKLRFFRVVPLQLLTTYLKEQPGVDPGSITKEYAMQMASTVTKSAWSCKFHCSKCGLAVSGKDSSTLEKRLPLMVQEMADDNPNLVAVWESMCDGGGMHHFARNNTSPQGFTLCSGGCRPLSELL